MASPIGKLSVVVLVLPLSSAVPPTGNACLLLPPSLHIFDTSKHLNTVMIRISFTSFTEPHIVIMIDWMIIQYSIFNIQYSIFNRRSSGYKNSRCGILQALSIQVRFVSMASRARDNDTLVDRPNSRVAVFLVMDTRLVSVSTDPLCF